MVLGGDHRGRFGKRCWFGVLHLSQDSGSNIAYRSKCLPRGKVDSCFENDDG